MCALDCDQGIDWGAFGFAGRGAEQSTLWLGTAGAHTLCHRDSYGLNLVAQLVGRSVSARAGPLGRAAGGAGRLGRIGTQSGSLISFLAV